MTLRNLENIPICGLPKGRKGKWHRGNFTNTKRMERERKKQLQHDADQEEASAAILSVQASIEVNIQHMTETTEECQELTAEHTASPTTKTEESAAEADWLKFKEEHLSALKQMPEALPPATKDTPNRQSPTPSGIRALLVKIPLLRRLFT